MTTRHLIRFGVVALALAPAMVFGVVWLAHTRPDLLLQPAVMLPLFVLATVLPALSRLREGLPGLGKRQRWIDRRID